jgi:hypothetical protein
LLAGFFIFESGLAVGRHQEFFSARNNSHGLKRFRHTKGAPAALGADGTSINSSKRFKPLAPLFIGLIAISKLALNGRLEVSEPWLWPLPVLIHREHFLL